MVDAHVAGQVDRSECAVRNCWDQWTRVGTQVRKTGSEATRKTTRREDRRIVRQALVDPTVTRSTIRADGRSNCSTNNFQTPCRSKILYPSAAFRACTLFNTGTSATASAVVPSQINVEYHRLAKGPFLNDLPGAIFSKIMHVRIQQELLKTSYVILRLFMAGPLPRFVFCRARVGDQLIRQMHSCHSVHDLELAVQDLWAHLPQDNKRCLINSMPDRVAACITTGGGATRY
ncbi:transposable element Tcb2 transposase [Trichonephila clavipes]|nr:transposable element Tcb2 transposase [Trichonephila clavipes]